MDPRADDQAPTSSPDADWWIGLDSWVLQDGNYTDFVTGERRQFALEFGYSRSPRLRPSAQSGPAQVSYTGRRVAYEVTGELIRSSTEPQSDGFVLDVGVRAYSYWVVLDDVRPPIAPTWLTGEIHLSVDPFFYVDELARLPGMPPLIYTWTIAEIQVDTTPLILVDVGHPLYRGSGKAPARVPDPELESWRTIERTRMSDEDRSYRLRCHLDAVEPASEMHPLSGRSPYGPLGPRT